MQAATWNGNGGNVNWSTGGNWVGGVPPASSSGTDLFFAGTNNTGTAGTPLLQNIANPFRLNNLTFSNGAGAFFLGGNAIEFQGASNTITQNSSSAQSIANNIDAGANTATILTLTGGGTGVVTLSGIISIGNGNRDYAIVKSGSGTFSLTGANTYAGGTTINGGTLMINSSANLGAVSGALTINAGTLEIATGFTTARSITLGSAASTFQVDPSQTYTVISALGGSGALNKTGTGTMALSGVNTYSGGTVVSAGTLRINASERLTNGGTLTISGGTFDLQTFTETTSTVTLASGSITGSGTGTLIGSSYVLQSGSVSAILGGTGVLTKTTAGTVTLSGSNTFTGSTTVSGGTLTVSAGGAGALGSTASVRVNSGGTLLLGANDQINNSATITLNGGTFSKGAFSEGAPNSAGLGALTLTSNDSHIDFGTGAGGVLSFASFNPNAFTLVIDNWTGTVNMAGGTDRLIFDTSQAFNLNNFSFTGYAGATEIDLGNGFYEITPTAVPEPSTYAAALLALGATAYHQRRRFRRMRTNPARLT